jgi:type II secretory pathway component GspD/PulD (secretin)
LNYVWQDSNGTKLVASMFALNWADSGDVLYSPRVTVRNNQMGTVYMGTVRYFPDEWEMTDSTTSNTTTTESSPQPTFSDDPEYLGLKISVQPQILDESRVIQVRVNFPIKTFVNWMVFDARQKSSSTEGGSSSDDGEYFKMPIFNDRSVDTVVQVYDGDTVLVGGVATDLTKTYHDKIPILGDLPLIGRLCQTKYTKAEKRNLLIFVTCRLVKANGTAFYPSHTRTNGNEKVSEYFQY